MFPLYYLEFFLINLRNPTILEQVKLLILVLSRLSLIKNGNNTIEIHREDLILLRS